MNWQAIATLIGVGATILVFLIGGGLHFAYKDGVNSDRIEHLEEWRRSEETRRIADNRVLHQLQVVQENSATRIEHVEVVVEKLDGKMDNVIITLTKLGGER